MTGTEARQRRRAAEHCERASQRSHSDTSRVSAIGISARPASTAANRNERSNDDVAARSSCSLSCRSSYLQLRPLAIARVHSGERPVDVGQASGLAADVARDARGELDLRECVDAGVQHELGTLLGRPVALAVEVGDEHGRQQDEPEHDARVARGDRVAAVDGRRRAPGQRGLGERAQREREADADQ